MPSTATPSTRRSTSAWPRRRTSPIRKGDWAFDPALEAKCVYDPAKARALLDEAGYEGGFEFTMPSIPIYQPRLEAMAGFFADVGITMHIGPVEPGTLARRSRTTDFPATNLVWGTVTDPKFLFARYIWPRTAPTTRSTPSRATSWQS